MMKKAGGPWYPQGAANNMQMKRPSGAQRKNALKMRLAAKGIKWDPNHWKRTTRNSEEKGPIKNGTKRGPSSQSPSAARVPAKKLKTAPRKTEDQAATDTDVYKEKMVISPVDYPTQQFTEEQVEKLQEAILSALEPLEDGCYPQFCGSYAEKGAVIMSCASQLTKTWLEALVAKLEPWDDAKFIIKPKVDVLQGGTKVLFKTTKFFSKTEPSKILQMLSNQNKTLITSKWRNISAKVDASGQTLIYMVDDESLEAIKALDNRAYLGLGNVEIVVLDKDKKNKDNPDKDSDNPDKETPDKETQDKEALDKETEDKEALDKETNDKGTPDKDNPDTENLDKDAPKDTEAKSEEQ